MNKYILLIASVFVLSNFAYADEVQVLATSPDHKYFVQRRMGPIDAMGGNSQFIDFINNATKKTIFSIRSTWRVADAGWSPNGELLYVNDRIVNSGDYLYVFSFESGFPVILKEPNDEMLDDLKDDYDKAPGTGRLTNNRELLDLK